MRKFTTYILGFLLLGLAFLAFTKPGALPHKNVALVQLKTYVQRNTQSNLGRDIPILSNVLGMAATHYTTPMLEQFVDNSIFIEDNIFFSRSYIMLGEERIDLAIGIGGQVYEMTDFQDKLNKVLGVSDLLETIGLQDKIKAKSN